MTSPARGRRATAVGVGALLALTVLAGCTSGGGTTDESASPSESTGSSTSTTSAAPSTSPPATTTGPSISEVPPTTAPPSGTPTATGSPTTAVASCAQLDVTVTRVPGAAGVTFGLISVTNRGPARCGLPGIPVVRLLDASRSPVTTTATAVGGTQGGIAIDPGAVASTLLEDRSGAECTASTRSSFAEVTPTPPAATVVLPLALPPCTLVVKPFAAGTQPSP